MTKPLTREEVRSVDRRAIEEYGMSGLVLMENAGRGAAELLVSLGITGPVVICAGKGNNGGDGFVMARHLELLGFTPRVLLFGDPETLSSDAAANYRILKAAGLGGRILGNAPDAAEVSRELEAADWVADALLGTGAQGTLRAPFTTVIAAINRANKRVFAVDLPSGMDCDTGKGLVDAAGDAICVVARHTATFVAQKRGFFEPGAQKLTGQVHVIGIGAPRRLLDEVLNG